jgi:hypothetical protein
MKVYLFIFLLLAFLSPDISDKSIELTDDSSKKIKLVETIYGGCNNRRDAEQTFEDEYIEPCVQSLKNDSLSVYVSIDYICCAPFKTNFKIKNDILYFYINDVCKDPYKDCYCRCHCVYTFDFRLINYEIKEYNYVIILNDPREEQAIKIESGVIDIRELMSS